MNWPVTINIRKEWIILCVFSPALLLLPSFTHYLSVWLSLFHIRDILPSTLKLPEAIHSAETLSDLHEVAQQGAGTDLPNLTHFIYIYKSKWVRGVNVQSPFKFRGHAPSDFEAKCIQNFPFTTITYMVITGCQVLKN